MNHEIKLVHKFCIGLKIVLLMEADIMMIFLAVNRSLKYFFWIENNPRYLK